MTQFLGHQEALRGRRHFWLAPEQVVRRGQIAGNLHRHGFVQLPFRLHTYILGQLHQNLGVSLGAETRILEPRVVRTLLLVPFSSHLEGRLLESFVRSGCARAGRATVGPRAGGPVLVHVRLGGGVAAACGWTKKREREVELIRAKEQIRAQSKEEKRRIMQKHSTATKPSKR